MHKHKRETTHTEKRGECQGRKITGKHELYEIIDELNAAEINSLVHEVIILENKIHLTKLSGERPTLQLHHLASTRAHKMDVTNVNDIR